MPNIWRRETNRALASIQSELRRRQAVFNRARQASDEGTIDIYKYQKLYRNGVVTEPVPHLFIVADEFAELKVQQPEFMDQLIRSSHCFSISRFDGSFRPVVNENSNASLM